MLEVKKGDKVILKGFTGVKLGLFEVDSATKKTVTVIKRNGDEMVFDRKTGRQINVEEGKERYANFLMEDDGSYVAPATRGASKRKKADKGAAKGKKAEVEDEEEDEDEEEAPKPKKATKKSKPAPEPEDDDDDEDEEEPPKPVKKSKKPAKKTKKVVEDDDDDDEFEEVDD